MQKYIKTGTYTKANRIILASIMSALIVYVVFRAFHISFTHDECLSYQILKGDAGLAKTANNHFINTWLMSVFYGLFGARELVLRLPNVLAFMLYCFFAYKLLSKVDNLFLMLTGLALLVLNPYLIDFFCLARGYGLSLGFGMAAVYYLFRQEGYASYRQFIKGFSLALLFSLLSAASNLICINLNIALVFAFFLEFLQMKRGNPEKIGKKQIGLIVMILLVNFFVLSLLVHQLFLLKEANQLYFGGANGFIENTLTILIHRSIYLSYYGEQFWMILRQLVLVVYLLTLVCQIFSTRYTNLSRITVLLTLMIFATVLQYYIFDSLYPTERTSLLFIPLFGLFMYFLMFRLVSALPARRYLKQLMNVLLVLVFCLPLGFHFARNMNLRYAIEWRQDAFTKDIMERIRDDHQKGVSTAATVTISNTWIFEPSINYYRDLYGMDYLNQANRDGVNESTDYIYCTSEDRGKLSPMNPYRVVSEYVKTGTVLLMK